MFEIPLGEPENRFGYISALQTRKIRGRAWTSLIEGVQTDLVEVFSQDGDSRGPYTYAATPLKLLKSQQKGP